MPATSSSIRTLADLMNRLGGIPLDRIRFRPYPGTATARDVDDIHRPAPVPALVPNLAVEVLSRSNTPGEMAIKYGEYFSAGVQLVWEINPEARQVVVYTSPTQSRTLSSGDTLDGGTVLPGFTLALDVLFGELDRQG
jgi:Uma2 family endonuclease